MENSTAGQHSSITSNFHHFEALFFFFLSFPFLLSFSFLFFSNQNNPRTYHIFQLFIIITTFQTKFNILHMIELYKQITPTLELSKIPKTLRKIFTTQRLCISMVFLVKTCNELKSNKK